MNGSQRKESGAFRSKSGLTSGLGGGRQNWDGYKDGVRNDTPRGEFSFANKAKVHGGGSHL